MSGTERGGGLSANSGLLAQLANPPQVNLLGAYAGANQVAQGIWANRLAQANQASGEAYQGAINQQTGEFDPQEYRRRLAGAGPTAALAAEHGLTTNQQLSDAQLKQAFAKLGFVQQQAGALLDGGDLSDAAIMGTFQKGIAAGVMTMPEVMRQLQTLPPDAAGRQKWAEQHRDSALSTQTQLEQQYGTGYTQNEGGSIGSGVTAPARRGGGQTGATSTPVTVSPETAATQVGRPITDPDEAKRYGVPVGTTLTEPMFRRLQQQGGGHLVVQPPTPSPIPGGGVYKPRGAAPAPGAPPDATQPSPASTAPPPQQTPPTATPAPAPAASEQSPAAPSYKGVVTSMPPGTEEEVKQYAADRSAIPSLQTGVVNLRTAKEALALTRSGPGTESTHRMYAFLVAQGVTPGFKDNGDIENWYIARKAMNAFVSGQAGKSGTDLGLGLQESSNANMEINQAAANHVLVQQIGLQNQKIAMNLEAPRGGVGYGEHGQTFTTKTTDPRGFAWDEYSPAERQVIIGDAKKSKDGYEKLVRSVELGIKHGLVHVPVPQTAAAPAPPPAPPAVKPNLLVPTN